MQVIEQVVPADDFIRLRDITGLSPRPRELADKALANSLYGLHLVEDGKVIGMGRIVGDGYLNFDIVDVAVDPDHQGKGYGNLIMQHIVDWLEVNAAKNTYVTLMADVPALYEKFGFIYARPRSEGMYWKRPA